MAIYRRGVTDKGIRSYIKCYTGTGSSRVEDRNSPPYYLREFNEANQRIWRKLEAITLVDAKIEIRRIPDRKPEGDRVRIDSAIEIYLEQKAAKARKTISQYEITLTQFEEVMVEHNIVFLDQVDEKILRHYVTFMRTVGKDGKPYAAKTIDTRLTIVYFLLNKHGMRSVRLPQDEMPKPRGNKPIPYSNESIDKLFAAMTPAQVIQYKFFLGTACRAGEVSFASWADIDFDSKEFHVREKPDVGFGLKSGLSRDVPLPTSVVEMLKVYKLDRPHERWLFINRNGKPQQHMLRTLKEIAFRIGLNCGTCMGIYKKKPACCKDKPICKEFVLHRFRKTCATRWHKEMDTMTLRQLLGHKDLKTTEGYLGVTPNARLRGAVDRAFGD